jgi:hypothetical protein
VPTAARRFAAVFAEIGIDGAEFATLREAGVLG